ncbi:hypothetical protein [Pedobacter sp. UC225_65]|uniref:hypothetical protein n=1 Tax=Pedobacter sp. UC225_65 TaxID=3350173 RepID=UPI00366C7FF8
MKTRLTLLAMLFSLCCFAQDQKTANAPPIFKDSIAGTSFFLKDRDIVYQKVFASNLKKEELLEKMNSLLSTIRNFRFNQNTIPAEAEIYGRLFFHSFDHEKYDYNMFNNSGYISEPLSAVVAIQVKDNKYRLTISEMSFSRDTEAPSQRIRLDEVFTQKRTRDKIKHQKANLKLAQYLDQEFTTLFNAKRSLLAGDF